MTEPQPADAPVDVHADTAVDRVVWRAPLGHPLSSAAALVTLGTLAAVWATAAARAAPGLRRDERLIFATRPRKAFWRYVASGGLFELTRRTTSFRVTDRRVLVERGFFHRTTRSIPLSGIHDVSVVCGPWQGVVRIAQQTGAGALPLDVGPLRAPAARAFASAIERALEA